MSDTYETVRVLGGLRDPVSVIREIVAGGLQEDPFYVLNLGEVVDRFRKWKKLMPRVEPFYDISAMLTEDLRDDDDNERERRALAARCNMLARRFYRCNEQGLTTLMSVAHETVLMLGGPWDPVGVIREIVAGGLQEDPFYVLDLGEVVGRYRKWKELMPRVEPFYAVKCNDDKLLVTTLAALGTGFDCASKAEIELVTSLGVRPELIIFANPAKMPSHIRHAAAAGVHTMTFDSETELYKIKEIFPHAKLVVRIRCDANDASYCLGAKFGCDAATEAPKLLVKAAMLGLEVIGVSFHVGSDCNEYAAYERGIRAARTVFDAAREAGHNELTLLDIGGGFPGRSSRGIVEYAEIINEALANEFPDQSVRVIAEPGRYFATAPYTLAVMVYSKREVKDDAGQPHTQYYINEGVFGSFMEELFHTKVNLQLLNSNPAEPTPSSIWGPTCHGSDCVMPSVCLPPLDVGDWIVFRDMGAYSSSLRTGFNGFEAARPKAVVDRSHWLLLKELPPFVASQFVEDSAWTPSTQKELNSTSYHSVM